MHLEAGTGVPPLSYGFLRGDATENHTEEGA